MPGFIDALEQSVLDHVTGKTTYTAPDPWWVALSTTTPTEAGGNFTEPGGGAYARVSITGANWNAAAGTAPAIADNTNAITFATATADWGTATHSGLFTGSTGGTVQIWGTLTASKRIGTDDVAEIAAGALDVKLGDPGDTY